jgi:predicted short-subunit dehydrogenase-like oxidoreductase (DUF2520 family)
VTGADPRSSPVEPTRPRLRIIGAGRAGGSLAGALGGAGWDVVGILGRRDDPRPAADGVDLVVIATPDAAIAEVAAAVEPRPGVVVAHLSGVTGQRVFEGLTHARTAVLHPLVAMPDPDTGARRLAAGAWFAVAGDALVTRAVGDLGGQWFEVAEADWVAHHAAAVIASNHVVAVLGQAERVAATAGVPFDVYLELVRATLDNVIELGPAAALTGPAARGDEATVAAHLAALDPAEREGYAAVAELARRLAGARSRPDADPE